MKTAVLLFLLCCALTSSAFSQPCLPEGITFTTQEQIDNFQNDYPGCTIIEGSVYIEGADIASLYGLVFLEAIQGDLVIGGSITTGTSLIDLYGLYYLESIGGSLIIENNPMLESLTGMDNLNGESIEYLSLCNNPMLSLCDVYSLCNFLDLPNAQANICDNGTGCNSIGEIIRECQNNCGYGEIFFDSQASIDNFQVNYPGCEDIYGYVTIDGNDITSLEGLSSIKKVYKRFLIGELYPTSSNPNLQTLHGLENLTYIGGWLGINWNESLIDCSGLDNLETIGAKLQFKGNQSLNSLNGLSNLKNIGKSLEIESNSSLVDIFGLDSISSIGDGLIVRFNDQLLNLDGFYVDNQISVVNLIDITQNPLLSTIAGFQNFDFSALEAFYVNNNYSLSDCAVEVVCDLLNDTTTTVNISNNAPGCNSSAEVRVICRTCFEEGIVFNTQAQVDSFAMNFPDCEYIDGDVVINGGANISNLEGLSVISSVGGNLRINENQNLQSLSGLNNISSVGGSLIIQQNQILNTLVGLNGISAVGESLLIQQNQNLNTLSGLNEINSVGGSLKIIGNQQLDSLTDLSGITSVGDTLWVEDNSLLSSLVGLHNLDPFELDFLHISNNPLLHYCEVESICYYLFYSYWNGSEIYNNAPGCNNPDEVSGACFINVNDISNSDLYAFYPVPADDVIIFTTQLDHVRLNILDLRGQVIATKLFNAGESMIEVSSFFPGVYILEVIHDQTIMRERLVIR